jgi:hypothetical protein
VKRTLLACALLFTSLSVSAKDQLIAISTDDASALQGKTLALTVHERPTFVAMSPSKASFGLIGAFAMFSAGNKLVNDNHIVDPAEIVRTNLADALRDVDGMKLAATDTTATKAQRAGDIAKTHPEADYVLDVRSAGWNYAYFPTHWGLYWVGYSVQVQLVDVKSGRQVSNAACNASTHENPNPPTGEHLIGDGAKLLKDVTAGLGWMCVQLLAKDEFHMPAEKIVATPAEYVDPLAAFAKAGTPAPVNAVAPATAPATADATQTTPAAATPGEVAPPAAPAAPVTSPPAAGTESSH